MQKEWKYRWSSTLGELESTAEKVWGIERYNPETDLYKATVFFGLYGLPDFFALWRHKGVKAILWAGTDIIHFKNGYWLDNNGDLRVNKNSLAKWINYYCDNYVENIAEYEALKKEGINSSIIPSFLGDTNEYNVSFKPGNKVYASVSGDNFRQYGWYEIEKMAKGNPDIEFHLYGNNAPWKTKNKNVIVHGRIPKEQMNEEIKEMQGGIRLLKFDGFSEILAKSILWGQWPISEIEYPHILKPYEVSDILKKKEPNLVGREYYLKTLNKYPWNTKY